MRAIVPIGLFCRLRASPRSPLACMGLATSPLPPQTIIADRVRAVEEGWRQTAAASGERQARAVAWAARNAEAVCRCRRLSDHASAGFGFATPAAAVVTLPHRVWASCSACREGSRPCHQRQRAVWSPLVWSPDREFRSRASNPPGSPSKRDRQVRPSPHG
jgi:hypothetical protein